MIPAKKFCNVVKFVEVMHLSSLASFFVM